MSRQEEQSRPDSCCSELCIRERWVGLEASTYWPAMDCCAVDGWSGQDTQLYPEAGKIPCISVSLICCRVKRNRQPFMPIIREGLSACIHDAEATISLIIGTWPNMPTTILQQQYASGVIGIASNNLHDRATMQCPIRNLPQ